jgi:outer membrane protein assembly factor BamB
MSVNPDNGKVLWKTRVHEEMPEESTHELGSWASASPLTDGKYIYAYFGSRGLFCLDMKGKLIWQRDFGQMTKRMSFGEGSSPGLSKDKIFVILDHEGDSFIYALDKKTGKDVWKQAREERTSWSSPKIIEVNGREQVIVSATGAIRGYDSETGEVIWHCTGLTHNVIPYPVVHNDVVFLMSGFRGNALFAVDLKRARGDINGTDMIVWSHDKDTPYTPSPLLWDGYIYFLKANNGILSCFNAETFEEMYSKERLEGIGNIYTSPVGANGHIYFVGQKGKVFVVKKGPEFEILAVNELNGMYCSSPAIVGNRIYIRSYETLYCFGK